MVDTVPMGAPDKDAVAHLLAARGITPTQQRLEIALILLAGPQHLSADQVLARVNHNGQTASKATVYNTLGLFADQGIIRQVIVDPARVFYDSNTRPHHHLYHVDTGALADIDADHIHVGEIAGLPANTEIESVDVIVRVRNKPA